MAYLPRHSLRTLYAYVRGVVHGNGVEQVRPSGVEHFAVPASGAIGLMQHKEVKGFNPIWGSHHKFYGAMDFFYVSTYYGGFTPGLQNLYATAAFHPFERFDVSMGYHYFATATKLD